MKEKVTIGFYIADQQNTKDLNKSIENVIEQELKLFKQIKSVTDEHLVWECLALYEEKMNQVGIFTKWID